MAEVDPATGEPKASKRAAEKAAKKAAAKAKKDTLNKVDDSKGTPKQADPNAKFKESWLKGVYNEKPVKDVHTRFPPEPNGYLHIGHAKAITVNFGFAKAYDGVCNLRFDDTNPAKEEERYFTSIKEMVSWLGFSPHKITYSSDQFDELYRLAEELIKKDKAYVCFCSPEEMLARRGGKKGDAGPRTVCEHWSFPPEKSLEEFRAMRDGKYQQGQALLRMKMFLSVKPEEYLIDKENDSQDIKDAKVKLKRLAENPAMWDVAAYRIKKDNHHHRTGDKWRIYPTYEFTHCICDSLEDITHSLCTVEFETLRPAYNWLLEQLDHKIPGSDEKGPMQREYGRLNVEGTILSKRRIQMLVDGVTVGIDAKKDDQKELTDETEKLNLAEDGEEDPEESEVPTQSLITGGRKIPPVVRDWDDPRLFTLVALRRRGVPPGALKKFVLDLGVTKAGADTKMHILDASIRNYLERTVPRLMLIVDPIKVIIENLPDDYLEEPEVPFDSKDPSKGTHTVPFTKTIYIDRDDFKDRDDPDFFRLTPSQTVGLLFVEYPLRVKSVNKDGTGKVTEIIAETGKDLPQYKARIHWVAESKSHKSPIKAEVRMFNALFKNPRPNELDWKNGGYYDNINPESEVVYPSALLESGFEDIRKGAPWPKEEGEAEGTTGNYSVRFQGVRTAFYCLDKDATEDKVILNRIVSLKEDTGKK